MIQLNKSNLCLLSMLVAATAANAESNGPKVGGFADAGWSLTKDSENTVHGFAINGGALYVDHEIKNSRIKLDLAFASEDAGNGLSFATSTSQAYVEHDFSENSSLRLGMFDTIYGSESNDTVDNFFASNSTLSGLLPAIQTGALYTLTQGALTLKLGVANIQDSSVSQDKNLDYGAQITFAPEESNLSLTLGSLFRRENDINKHLGNLVVNFEANDANKTTLEASIINETTKEGRYGAMLQHVMGVSDKLSLGLRGEYGIYRGLENDNYAVTSATLGSKYQLSEQLSSKISYTWLGSEAQKGQDLAHSSLVEVSAVYNF